MNCVQLVNKWITFVLLKLISLYQRTISPDHSYWGQLKHPNGYCKHYPTCSDYAKEVVVKHGPLRGGLKAGKRVLKCNPWSKGGVDMVE